LIRKFQPSNPLEDKNFFLRQFLFSKKLSAKNTIGFQKVKATKMLFIGRKTFIQAAKKEHYLLYTPIHL